MLFDQGAVRATRRRGGARDHFPPLSRGAMAFRERDTTDGDAPPAVTGKNSPGGESEGGSDEDNRTLASLADPALRRPGAGAGGVRRGEGRDDHQGAVEGAAEQAGGTRQEDQGAGRQRLAGPWQAGQGPEMGRGTRAELVH